MTTIMFRAGLLSATRFDQAGPEPTLNVNTLWIVNGKVSQKGSSEPSIPRGVCRSTISLGRVAALSGLAVLPGDFWLDHREPGRPLLLRQNGESLVGHWLPDDRLS